MFMQWGATFDGGMTMFSLGPDGEVRSGVGGIPCEPGDEFTEYVRTSEVLEPFPYSSMQMANIERTNFWKDRRLELYLGANKREAKVVKWLEWNTGPMCPCTRWDITISVAPEESTGYNAKSSETRLEKDHLVEMHGLTSSKGETLNGKFGTIQKFEESERRYVVGLMEGEEYSKVLKQLKPENVKLFAGEITFDIKKADVKNGGVLQGKVEYGMPEHIIFKWLDPPFETPLDNMEEVE